MHWWMTCSIKDVKKATKLIEDVVKKFTELDDLFTRLGPRIFIGLSEEEKNTIDASLEGNDSLSDTIDILDNLRVEMMEEGGEDSEEDGEDDEFW
jgi:hypothetical protein